MTPELPDDDIPPSELDQLDQDEWEKEIDRRVEEIRSGKAVGYPVEEVLAEIRKQLR